ncbi:MAG: protein phosphatase 2C domain-containing protein [Bacteroidota bacterium]
MTAAGPRSPGAMPTEVVSVTGRRDHNEDVGRAMTGMAGETPVALLLVADGMGGHAHGEVASRLAADALVARWENLLARLGDAPDEAEATARQFLREGYAEAERAIATQGRGNGMGTTLVAALVVGDGTLLANLGDSRAYVVRDDGAALITEDHSVVADAVRQGALTPEEAEHSPFQHALTRALDGSGDAEPDLFPSRGWVGLGPSGAVLLCSDGLSGAVGLEDLHRLVAGTPNLGHAARHLVALALERGTPDNVTVAIAEHGRLRRAGTSLLAPERVEALLSTATEASEGGRPPPDPPERDLQPRESLGKTPWVLTGLAVFLLLVAILVWTQRREAPASTLRGPLPPVSLEPPRPVPTAFDLTTDGTSLRWAITGIATRDDSVRITVALPADTLTQTVQAVGSSVELAEIAAEWPGAVLEPGRYVWCVEARSLSGSRLRSGPADLVLEQPVWALPSSSLD